ncbi:hypothetical protein AAMO2058_001241600 [Amorphochlora amoebiformis]
MASTHRAFVAISGLLGVLSAFALISLISEDGLGLAVSRGSVTTRGTSRMGQSRASPWVSNALSRTRKEETVAILKENIEQSNLVFGMKFNGLSVKQMEGLRKKLPEDAKIRVAMNTLMKRAGEEVDGFGPIEGACTGDNAWWFVGENVASGVKAYIAFEDECKKAAKADPNSPVPELSGGVMDGTFLDADKIKALKSLPTRSEVIAQIAGCIQAVPTKLARSIKQVPQKMAVGVSKLADGDDNKDLIVGDVFPKAEA